jgi:hypothetical protein
LFFLITIDTEGDNLWAKPQVAETENAKFLPRFQELCESYRLKPTYLTNYEMARSPYFQEFGRDIIKHRSAEIGMHLHAWDNPPLVPLTQNDMKYHPFLVEYPEKVMRDKINFISEFLEDTFGERPISHRAGRWNFNETYAKILHESGYLVDCSITPNVSWKLLLGDPGGTGGPDYRFFPEQPYFLDLKDIRRPGRSPILEIPTTVIFHPAWLKNHYYHFKKRSVSRRLLNRLFRPIRWLRPRIGNLSQMLGILDLAVKEGRDYVELMLHSSELMPGGSPTFSKEKDIDRLYDDLEHLFVVSRKNFQGATLGAFYHWFSSKKIILKHPSKAKR